MIRRLTKAKEAARLIANGDAVAAIHDRGRPRSDPDSYLTINQPADVLAVARLKERAVVRRRTRAAKRAATWNGRVGRPCAGELNKEGRCYDHDA